MFGAPACKAGDHDFKHREVQQDMILFYCFLDTTKKTLCLALNMNLKTIFRNDNSKKENNGKV